MEIPLLSSSSEDIGVGCYKLYVSADKNTNKSK
jgi:hypothetical protein